MSDTSSGLQVTSNEAGSPGFDQAGLRDARDVVIPAATARYSIEAVCTGKKVAPRDSRRADYYERCEFNGLNEARGNATLTAVTYHFLSSQLVQIDAQLAGSALVMAPLATSLDALLGESDFTANNASAVGAADGEDLPQAIYLWTKAADVAVARLQTAAAADDETFEFSLQHPKVADVIVQLPAL